MKHRIKVLALGIALAMSMASGVAFASEASAGAAAGVADGSEVVLVPSEGISDPLEGEGGAEPPIAPPDGWEYVDGKWCYAMAGVSKVNCKTTIDGSMYIFDAEGFMCSGWTKFEGEWYYLGTADQGYAHSGWLKWGGKWYYFDPIEKSMVRGWADLGSRYYFGEGEDDGAMATYWREIDGNWYYFGTGADDGVMKTGWVKYGSSWYLLNTSGVMRTGWVQAGSNWYHFEADGKMSVYWRQIDGDWYYFGGADDGVMKTGWVQYEGNWYLLNTSGVMRTGWVQCGSDWYYLWSSGAMATGMHTIDGKSYYFDADGKMRDLTADERYMTNKAQGYYSSTNWLIMVDTTRNQLGIYYGSKGNWGLKYFWQCSTGAWATPTVLGEYQVTGKGYSFGSGFTCYYYTQFYGDYLIHSVTYYQNTFTVMEGKMGVNISHGCVRLPIERAKWIYDNIPYGTKVVTYR